MKLNYILILIIKENDISLSHNNNKKKTKVEGGRP